jgi:tetratricopeptide (TPR) repeat protein
MILVLDRLGKRYFETGDFQRSVHAFSAAISLREKLSLGGDLRPLLELRSAARENLGAHAEALEDLVRSAYLMQNTGIKPDNRMKERFRTLTKSLGLDGDKIFEAFILLWESRKKADIQGEARALLMVAEAYDRAQRFPEALKYYERSSALLLANRAEVFGKMGKEKLAEEHYSQALEALRNLDYSGYIHIMKKSKMAGAQLQH